MWAAIAAHNIDIVITVNKLATYKETQEIGET